MMEPALETGFGSLLAIGSETSEAEREFDKVLEELREAEGLKYYADVYTKLYDMYHTLKEDYEKQENEIKFIKVKLGRFDAQTSEYISEINEQNKRINFLQRQLEDAKALADAMHARELATVESLETIRKSAARLEKELEARKRSGEEDAGTTSAVKEKEKFEKEKARLQGEVDALKVRLNNSLNFQDELEAKNTAAEETIARLEENMEEAENNAVRSNRLIDFMKSEVAALKGELEARGHTITHLNDKLEKCDKTLERKERWLKEATAKLIIANQEMDSAQAKAHVMKETLDETNVEFNKTKQKLLNTEKELKNTIDDGVKLRNEVTKLNKQLQQQYKRYQLLEESKSVLKTERDRLRQQVSVMEREIYSSNKKMEADRREIENYKREKEVFNKQLQKIQNEAIENLNMLHLQENRRKQLEHEVDTNIQTIQRQRLTIRQLEKDKDRMLEESIALNEKIDDITEEVRLRLTDIIDLKKALREENIKTRKLSVALDTTRAERNMLHKNYIEALDEIQDLKQKMKMLAYQIEQLKEDIGGKEQGLKTCESSLSKCAKKNEQLRMEIQLGLTRLSEARADIAALKQEEARLNRILGECDAARAKLTKELEGLMNERDVVGAQLVRRNDEISLLYEKIRILEITLQRGEKQYEQRVEDIRLLRLEIIRLRKEKNLLSKGIENMTDLRLEVFNLERELGRERLRVRALEEALETPLNVHRWRKLQGTDPEAVHLTQKLRLTQKKVLAQSEMLVLKERELKETRNLYGAVKDMLALQPSPEIKMTLNRTQRALANRTSKMKCLIAELSMRERQVTDLKLELDRVNGVLTKYKQQYYDMKRVLDLDEQRRLRLPSPVTPHSPTDTDVGGRKEFCECEKYT